MPPDWLTPSQRRGQRRQKSVVEGGNCLRIGQPPPNVRINEVKDGGSTSATASEVGNRHPTGSTREQEAWAGVGNRLRNR